MRYALIAGSNDGAAAALSFATVGAPAEKVEDLFGRESTWNADEVGIAKGEQVP